jgi:hypothetical protein
MCLTSFGKRWSLVALVAGALLTGDAWAQRGERERGGGRDRDGGSSFRGGGGGEGRSFRSGGGGDRSFSRSMSGGSERSFSRGSRSGESFRSIERSPSANQSLRSGQSMRESFRGSGRGTIDAGRPTSQPYNLDSPRTFSRGTPRDSGQIRNQQSFRSRGDTGMRTARLQGESQQNQNRYQANRPTEDRVRDFLQMPQDRGNQQSRDTTNRNFQGEFRRNEQPQRNDQQVERRNLTGRIGDPNRRGQIDNRERDFTTRDGRNRNFGDRDFDGNYERWRNNVWTGDDRRGRDDRDWSGRWRDGSRFDVARQIRQNWRDRDWDDDDFPFRIGWWGGRDWHGHRWDHWDHFGHSRPFYWWYWATAPRLSNWITYRWGTPYYWDYGPGEYIYYDDGAIYINGRWHQPAPVFYENTVRLVEQAPDLTPQEAASAQWLPLGVFAVTRDGRAQADVLVQLAVTQEGVIGGTASDQQSGTSYPIEGVVEKQSQRAVWSYTDARGRRVVMETSIFNLTQPEATGLVHYSPENIEVIELVRLDPPESASTMAGAAGVQEGELPAPRY